MITRPAFLALDDAWPGHEKLTMFAEPIGTIRASEAAEVPAALAAIGQAH